MFENILKDLMEPMLEKVEKDLEMIYEIYNDKLKKKFKTVEDFKKHYFDIEIEEKNIKTKLKK